MTDSIIAYTMGGCRYPCRNMEDCSMTGVLSPLIEESVPFHWGSRLFGPDFSTLAVAYAPRETRKVRVTETVKDEKTGQEKEVHSEVEREFLVMEKATILTAVKVETDPGRPYCNVAVVMRGADGGYRSRVTQAMKEKGRQLEYTPHDNMVDIMVASGIDCPNPCSRLSGCGLYSLMDSSIRKIEKDMRGRDFVSFSVCEGEKKNAYKLCMLSTAYGFNDMGGSTVLNLVKVMDEESQFCVMMTCLHGESEEERLIGTAIRHILDVQGEAYGARKLI